MTGINQNDVEKNIIENLKYISEDLSGNTYTITAQSATLKEDKLNEIQLFEVNAEIVRKNQEIIYKATPNSKRTLHYGSRIIFDKENYIFFSINIANENIFIQITFFFKI